MAKNYNLEKEFNITDGREVKSSSDVPINPFVFWDGLRYYNEVTYRSENKLPKQCSSYAGVEVKLPWNIPYSIIFVHGRNKEEQLVNFLFISRELAETFAENELTDVIIWELPNISLEELRSSRKLPSLLSSQIPVE